MTDSPSPIDSSFDYSEVATPCTVIAAKSRFRNDEELEGDGKDFEDQGEYTAPFQQQEGDSVEHEDLSNIYVDDLSKDFSECASSVMEPLPKPHTFAKTITKVYYHLDDESVPYMVDVHVPPDCITLRDVKRKLPRTNFKYYCIALDPESGREVKAEIRDDSQRLYPLRCGRFELYLLTVEGSTHSDNSSGRHRSKHQGSSKGSSSSREYQKAAHRYDNPTPFSDNDSQASSYPTYMKKADAFNKRRQASQAYDRLQPSNRHHGRHHHQNHYEDSTFDFTTESNDHYRDGVTYYDEDEDDSRSINTDLTSVSQIHLKQRWKQQQQKEIRNKWSRIPSMSTTSSSISSITESSMGLELLTVRLNLQTMPLGMTPYGYTTARGDAGIYVGNILDRGAVALDGRIDVGDMISEIDNIDLSNYSNKEAIQLLRDAVARGQFVSLTVAKSNDFRKHAAAAFPKNPRAEPVRPIDTNEWIKHGNAMKGMPSISEESSSTPIPDEWPTNSSASGTPFGGQPTSSLDTLTDKKRVVEIMAAPGSGLEIKDRLWMKMQIEMSFLGKDLVDWLFVHVQGFGKRREAYKFAKVMFKLGYIKHSLDINKFSEKCYYNMGKECAEYTQLRAPDGGYKYAPSHESSASVHSGNNNIFPPSMYPHQTQTSSAAGANAHSRNSAVLNSMVSGYASMPSSPFPSVKPSAGDSGRTRDDIRSQTSGSSQGSRRYVELPRKPASLGSGSGISDQIHIDRVASRSSFRAAMSGSLRQFPIDN